MVNSIAEDFTTNICNGSMKILEEKVEKMADVQDSFETMGTKLYRLLNTGGQRDFEGDVGSAKVE